MKTTARTLFWIGAPSVFLILAGCQAATPPPTLESTGAKAPSLSYSPAAPETRTADFTPTDTLTLTPTSTQTPPYNEPGKYQINKCVQFRYKGAPFDVAFCVSSVTVNDDYTMKFYVSWKILASKYSGIRVRKYSDSENRNMFLDDNLGNRYDHIGTGGCAAEISTFGAGDDCTGWFLFPEAAPGATSFRFNDADSGVFIDEIVLWNATPTPTPTVEGNVPGTYRINRCVGYDIAGTAYHAVFCLLYVKVEDDLQMRFVVNWKFSSSTTQRYTKQPDTNQYIYLEDNLGYRYEHVQLGGCAAFVTYYTGSGDCTGWFLFPRATLHAESFRLMDGENEVFIDDIVLYNAPPTGTVTPPTVPPTATPTKTPTGTRTGTPTKTPTPTPTVDPNAVYNGPGTYWLYKCVPYPAVGGFANADRVTLCLNTVVINADGTMKFNLTWEMSSDESVSVVKQSDANNRNIYLQDNLGGMYHHQQTGGCAAQDEYMSGRIKKCSGWFLFPPAAPGVTSFQFVNHDLLVFINDIVLVKTQ